MRARLAQELVLALLQRDRVDDPFALQAPQPGLEHGPLRAVDHDRQARDLGLGRDHVQERRHRLLALEQVGVHVHVEHVGAAAHLLERDVDRRREVARLDQAPEARGAGDVRALADQDEAGVGADLERLEAAEPGSRHLGTNRGSRLEPAHGFGDRARVLRCRAAARADDVQEPVLRELAQQRRGHVGRLVVAAERVRQAGVRVAGGEARSRRATDRRRTGASPSHRASS